MIKLDDVAVVPVLQFLRLGIAGQLTQVILVAGCLAWVVIAVVEAGALERDVAGLGIDVAACDVRPEGLDQTTGANDQREAVITMLAMQPQRQLAGEIHPAGHEFAFAGRGKVLGQFVHDACAEQELKELGLGDIGSQFDVIEAAGAKLIEDKSFVVFEYDQIHGSTP